MGITTDLQIVTIVKIFVLFVITTKFTTKLCTAFASLSLFNAHTER